MVLGSISKVFRGKLCSTAEDEVIVVDSKDQEGSLPLTCSPRESSKDFTTSILDDLEVADVESESAFPLPRQCADPESRTPKMRLASKISRRHPWTKLKEEDDGVYLPETKSRVRSNIRLVRSKLFAMRAPKQKNARTQSPCTAPTHSEGSVKARASVSLPSPPVSPTQHRENKLEDVAPEEEIVFTKSAETEQPRQVLYSQRVLLVDDLTDVETLEIHESSQEEAKEENRPGFSQKIVFTTEDIAPKKVSVNPPVREIGGGHRKVSSDISELSFHSGSKGHPLEFSLEFGFEGKSPNLNFMSGEIVRSLERVEQNRERERQAAGLLQPGDAKCVILLMDPLKKIFEVVPAHYVPGKTTVGDILGKLPQVATDYRLARLTYTGLAYNGVHISAPLVPVDLVLEAQSAGKPLFAIPEYYSAGQIQEIGDALMQTPRVAQLLEEQIAKANHSDTKCANDPPLVIETTSGMLPTTARQTPMAAGLFTSNIGRLFKSNDV